MMKDITKKVKDNRRMEENIANISIRHYWINNQNM